MAKSEENSTGKLFFLWILLSNGIARIHQANWYIFFLLSSHVKEQGFLPHFHHANAKFKDALLLVASCSRFVRG